MNTKFHERIVAFDKLSQQYQLDINKAKQNDNESIDEIRKKYENEMAEYVKNSNEKYSNMLIERLNLQEQIRHEYETKINKLTFDLETSFKDTLEKQLGQLRASLNGGKQEALMNLKNEYEEKILKCKEESRIQLDNILNEIKKKNQEIIHITSEKDSIINDLNNKINDMNNIINTLSLDSNTKAQNLIDNINNLQLNITELNSTIIIRALLNCS